MNVTFRYTRYFVYDVTTVGERFGRYGTSDSFNWFLGNKRPYQPVRSMGASSSSDNTRDIFDDAFGHLDEKSQKEIKQQTEGSGSWLPEWLRKRIKNSNFSTM